MEHGRERRVLGSRAYCMPAAADMQGRCGLFAWNTTRSNFLQRAVDIVQLINFIHQAVDKYNETNTENKQ